MPPFALHLINNNHERAVCFARIELKLAPLPSLSEKAILSKTPLLVKLFVLPFIPFEVYAVCAAIRGYPLE